MVSFYLLNNCQRRQSRYVTFDYVGLPQGRSQVQNVSRFSAPLTVSWFLLTIQAGLITKTAVVASEPDANAC